MLYAVFEDGIEENEWWLLETFSTLEEANDLFNDLTDEETGSRYRIVEYVENRVVKGE